MGIINIIGVLMLAAYMGLALGCLDVIKRDCYPRMLRLQLWWAWMPILLMVVY